MVERPGQGLGSVYDRHRIIPAPNVLVYVNVYDIE